MLTTRSLYGNEVEFYRRSDQRGMSLGHNSSLGDQYDTNSQLSGNNSPQSDTDKSAPPRKRVPVACGRCRKRKIKCSGDEGGNRGCSNCRNAGSVVCQFLRVQSSELPMGVQYQTLKGWQMSHRYSPYSSGVSGRYKSFATPQYGDSAVYSGLPTATNFDPYSTSASSCSWTRPSCSPHYGLTYSDEPNAHYSTQPPPPSYMLPNTDPMNTINSVYLNNNLGRAQQATLWTDQVTSTSAASSMTTSNGSQVSSAYGLQGTENATFHTINTSSTDRILPTPSASRTIAAAPPSTVDTHCLSALSSHRGSLGWSTDTTSTTSAGSSRTSNSTDSDSRLAPSEPSQDMVFGYDMSLSTQNLSSTTTNDDLSHTSQDMRGSFDGSQRVRTVSRESNSYVPSPPDTVGNYTYSSSWDRGHPPSGKMTTGTVYRRVPSLSTVRTSNQQCSGALQQNSILPQDCTQDTSGWQSHSQRGSVASLSNSSSFSNHH